MNMVMRAAAKCTALALAGAVFASAALPAQADTLAEIEKAISRRVAAARRP